MSAVMSGLFDIFGVIMVGHLGGSLSALIREKDLRPSGPYFYAWLAYTLTPPPVAYFMAHFYFRWFARVSYVDFERANRLLKLGHFVLGMIFGSVITLACGVFAFQTAVSAYARALKKCDVERAQAEKGWQESIVRNEKRR